jgi:hypothetical protein
MEQLLQLLLSAFVVLCGASLLYMGCFLYENEEEKIQNVLEDAWVRIDDSRRAAVSRTVLLLNEVAYLTQRFLQHLFGPVTISKRTLVASLCCSIVSLALLTALVVRIGLGASPNAGFLAAGGVSLIILCFGLARLRWFQLTVVWLFGFELSIVALRFCVAGSIEENNWIYTRLLSMNLGLMWGIGCDLLFLAVFRRFLGWMRTTESSLLLAGVGGSILGGTLLIVSPLLFAITTESLWGRSARFVVFMAGTLTIASNGLIAAIVLAFSLTLLVLTIHRLVWPMIGRPMYALCRLEIFRRRKLLIVIGILLTLSPLPNFAKIVLVFLKQCCL